MSQSREDCLGAAIFCAVVFLSAVVRPIIRPNDGPLKEKIHLGPEYYCLPVGAKPYKQTKTFTVDTIPGALKNDHRTAEGVWGLVHVCKGELKYVVAPDEYSSSEQTFILDETCCGLIEPMALHRIEASSDDVQCYVEFWK